MPSVPIPEFTGKWKDRIAELLKEAEDLSLRELEREKILAEAFRVISGFFQELKTEKYEEELRKDYIDAKTKDVFAPYFKKICGASERIKNILGHIKKSNEEILKNAKELAYLVKEHNSSMWYLIREDERKLYLQFQAICGVRYKKCIVINTSLDCVSSFIDSMGKMVKEADEDIKKFDTRRVVEYLNSEKQIFLEAAKAQLKELGFESSSMKDITELEELIQVISNSRLFDEKRREKNGISWRVVLKKTILVYASIFTLYAGGFQMVLPAFFTSLNMGRKLPVEIHHKAIFDALAENSAKVEFNTPDGKECTGYLVKNKGNVPTDKIVIFVHGKSSNATWLLPYIQKLRMATDNIDFLTINLRGHGPDKPDEWLRTTTLGLKEAYDVTGAINYAAELGYTEVVVYGHSIGGAAVINAVGKYGNLISDRIRVKGVIVEKTFANLHDFLRRSHKNFFSDYGQNIYRALVGGTEFAKTHVEPTGLQAFGTSKLLEAMSSFKVSENNPSEAIKNIDAPVMVIGVEEGDVCMTRRDADVLAHNAKRGYEIMVSRPNDGLIERHSPEFNNPAVLANMMKFVEAVI